jgi:phosphohistidine phosphatase
MSGGMKRLLLLRHAKSAWPPGAEDHDRPLVPRGITAAGLIADHIVKSGLKPAAIAVSSAKRTRETFALMAPKLGQAHGVLPEIYNASLSTLLDVVHGLPVTAASAMIVGHNPGIGDLARALASPHFSDAQALERLSQKVPTAALAVIDCDVETWLEVRLGTNALRFFVTPRQLGGVDED